MPEPQNDDNAPKTPQDLVPADDSATEPTPQPVPVPALRADEPPLPARKRRRSRPPVPPPQQTIVQPRSCLSTCAMYGGLGALVIVVVLAFAFLLFADAVTDFSGDLFGDVRTFLGLEDVTPEVVDTQVIVLGIRNMAVLQTTSGDLLIEKEVVEDQPLRKDPFVRMRYVGRVTAGIDLAAIEAGDVVVSGLDSAIVTLPAAHLTGCFLENAEQLDASCGTTFFGMTSCTDKLNDLQRIAQRRAKEDLVQMADELDLIEQAYDSAEVAVGGLLSDLGFERVEFERSTEEAPPDASCEL